MDFELEKKLFSAIGEINVSLREIKTYLRELDRKLGKEEKDMKIKYPAYEDYISN